MRAKIEVLETLTRGANNQPKMEKGARATLKQHTPRSYESGLGCGAANVPMVIPAESSPPPTLGLTAAEAAARLGLDGPNEIARAETPSPIRIFLRQLTGPFTWLLLGACGLSAVLGDALDAIAIVAIVILNSIVGFVQEFRAERALLSLRDMTAPRARVLRDGASIMVPAREIVVGDCLILEAGDILPADARIVQSSELSTQEAALTGESASVAKSAAVAPVDAPLAERSDTVFLGTSVATGAGRAIVFATGMRTELGKIARLLSTTKVTETPLQQRLSRVGRYLLILCSALVVVVAIAMLARGHSWNTVLLSSVSLAVAAVPEGLAAIVTIALALGVQRMASHNVLVRRLLAVETLGSTTVICTDKTGTLTTGVMTVREIWGRDHLEVLTAATANCDAELGADGRSGVGDPTEVAILRAAAERGLDRAELERQRPRVLSIPFDTVRRTMSTLRSDGVLYVKGAVEAILARCESDQTEPAERAAREMAALGLRVLAVAKGTSSTAADDANADRLLAAPLECIGLLGIADPPRTEAIEAIAMARAAGIKTIMITGDHPVTARAIAREMGIVQQGESEDERVIARATPEDKLDLVKKLKAAGEVVAMTGDGVNDAPALHEAHVGIAMGKTGTEVAREASSMILGDDDFASVVAAVREGRSIYDNIRKTLVYLLSGNFGELLLMAFAAVLGSPMPLIPLQLLWVNLLTDGLPAIALVMDPPRDDVLSKPPRPPREPILRATDWLRIGLTGAFEAAIVYLLYRSGLDRGEQTARALAFNTLVVAEVMRSFAARSDDKTLFEVGALSNVRLILVVLVTLSLQAVIYAAPFFQDIFEIRALTPSEWLSTVAIGLIPVSALELLKLARRWTGKRPLPH